jgi:hypothetical protein
MFLFLVVRFKEPLDIGHPLFVSSSTFKIVELVEKKETFVLFGKKFASLYQKSMGSIDHLTLCEVVYSVTPHPSWNSLTFPARR